MNAAYIKENFNTTVISGINYYPWNINSDAYINRFVGVFAMFIMPVCLVMGFPIFLLTIVSEKEKKLIEVMKINGLNMSTYWIVNYVFFFLYYLITMFVFLFFAKYVFKVQAINDTNFNLILLMYVGWGMAQISWAFFISVFINRSTVAAIAGFGVSIFFMVCGTCLEGAIYVIPFRIPWYYFTIPSLTFIRTINYQTNACLQKTCYMSLLDINESEFKLALAMLYV